MNPQELEVDGEPEFCESNVRVNQNPNRDLVDLGTAPGEHRRRPCFENDLYVSALSRS
jgi:hypothetical protein